MKHQQLVPISLDEITEQYEKGLLDQLRGFGVEGELFETWVPDPDPTNSILNLVEAAIMAGSLEGLAVTVSRKTMSDVSRDRLIDELGGIVTVRLEDFGDSSVISLIDFEDRLTALGDSLKTRRAPLSRADATGAVLETVPEASFSGREDSIAVKKHPETKNRLYDLPKKDVFDREGALEEDNHFYRVTLEEDDCVLEVQVDPKSHIVEKAAFRGSWERDVAALLDLLCESVESRPIQDMSDHAVGRLEHRVRGARSRPVPGIVLPSAVDPRFVLIQGFVRKILAQYRQSAGFQETENTFDDDVGKWWRSLTETERVESVHQVVQTEARNLGFDSSEVELAGIEYGVRVLIRFSGEMASSEIDKQRVMMQLEQALKEHLDSRLELFLEPLQDQSILRRLSAEEE